MAMKLPWKLVVEWISEGEGCFREIVSVLAEKRTRFQEVMVAELSGLGKSLVIDGKVQSSLLDEHWYHEALVHPVMITHPRPRRVLVLGGGEGATIREVLRHRSVEEVVMVDIDRDVIEFAKKHLEEWHQGSFNDKRVRLVIGDGREYITNAARRGEYFDVVILDLVDPTEGGPATKLYTVEFYEKVREVLRGEGIMVTQATSPTLTPRVYAVVKNSIARVFRITTPYVTYVRSYNGLWGFVTGSDKLSPKELSREEVAKRLRERIGTSLRFYDEETHTWMFSLPKPIRELLETIKDYATDENPVYVPV